MATKSTNNRLNRTLLILLGILLACVLTLNAKPLYSVETFQDDKVEVNEQENAEDVKKKVASSAASIFSTLVEKFASLK